MTKYSTVMPIVAYANPKKNAGATWQEFSIVSFLKDWLGIVTSLNL